MTWMPLLSSAPRDFTARMQRMAASPRLAMARRRMGLISVNSRILRRWPEVSARASAQARTMSASTFRTAPIPQQIPVRSTLFYGCRQGSAALLQIALGSQRAALSGASVGGTATAQHKETNRSGHDPNGAVHVLYAPHAMSNSFSFIASATRRQIGRAHV